MRTIEHSTTPHDVVNSLSHSGDEFQKTTIGITASSFTARYTNDRSPIRPGFRTHHRRPQNFLKPNAGVGIVSSLFALGSILSFIALH
jgi:hypothetical protein